MKPLRLLLLSAALLLMLVILLVGLNWGDEPPPDDADLLPVEKLVAEEDDGYPLLMEAIAAFEGVSNSTRLKNFARDGSDDEWLEQELAKHEEALRLFEEAVARPVIALPKIPALEVRENFGQTRELARLVSARGQMRLRDGRTSEGLNDILLVTRLGRKLAGRAGSLTDLLTGIALQGAALKILREDAPHLRLNSRDTRRFLRELDKERFPRETFASALRAEYANTKEIHAGIIGSLGGSTPWYQGFGYLIKPNKALRMVGEQTREVIALVEEPVYVADDWPDEDLELEKSLPLENALGRMMAEVMAPTTSRVMLSGFLTEANFGNTQLVVALSGFENAEGELPDSLDELVGTWIEAVPVDPFSGEPLRYSKADRLVFSVGPEGDDDPSSVDTSGKGILRGFVVPEKLDEEIDQ